MNYTYRHVSTSTTWSRAWFLAQTSFAKWRDHGAGMISISFVSFMCSWRLEGWTIQSFGRSELRRWWFWWTRTWNTFRHDNILRHWHVHRHLQKMTTDSGCKDFHQQIHGEEIQLSYLKSLDCKCWLLIVQVFGQDGEAAGCKEKGATWVLWKVDALVQNVGTEDLKTFLLSGGVAIREDIPAGYCCQQLDEPESNWSMKAAKTLSSTLEEANLHNCEAYCGK